MCSVITLEQKCEKLEGGKGRQYWKKEKEPKCLLSAPLKSQTLSSMESRTHGKVMLTQIECQSQTLK